MATPIEASVRSHIKYELHRGWSNEQIVGRHRISHRTVECMRALWKATGEVYIERSRGRRHLKLSKLHCNMLLQCLEDRPQAYLDEIAWFLYDDYDLEVDKSTIWRSLQRIGWSQKRPKHRAAQASNELRNHWMMYKLRPINAEQMIFLDESAGCERTGMVSGGAPELRG